MTSPLVVLKSHFSLKASDYTRLRAKFYDETLQIYFLEVNERSELSIFDFER